MAIVTPVTSSETGCVDRLRSYPDFDLLRLPGEYRRRARAAHAAAAAERARGGSLPGPATGQVVHHRRGRGVDDGRVGHYLGSAPATAVFGLASVFLYVLPAIVFLLPVSLVAAELASGWEGGVYNWVREGLSPRWA